MDKQKQTPQSAPQTNPELEKYRKYSPFVLGILPPSEYPAILKYIWGNPPPPEPPDK